MKLERVSFVLGLALFAWLVSRIGLTAIARNLGRLGWGFAAILALEAAPLLLATLGWRSTRRRLRDVPLRSLLGMRLAGDAINAVAPAAVLGGEIVRGKLLSRFLPPADVLASVSLAAMAQFVAQVLFVGAGCLVVPVPGLQPRLRIMGIVLLGLLALFVALVVRLSDNRPRPRALWPRVFERVDSLAGGRLSRAWLWSDLKASVADAVRGRNGHLTISVLFFLGGWLVTGLEVFLILRFLGAPASAGTAFSIAVLMVFVEGVFFFVPARAGVLEGGLYAIFSVLGLDPVTGFSLALVRRLRELAWAAAGLMVLGFSGPGSLAHPARGAAESVPGGPTL